VIRISYKGDTPETQILSISDSVIINIWGDLREPINPPREDKYKTQYYIVA
jgi:hypothetical protein